MVEPISITKAKPSAKSMNYALLVEEGIKYIQKWGGNTWTDHNPHDSGITILEALSFSMTELGYRGQLAMPELLDSNLPLESMAIYAPDEVLSCNSITAQDFQKLLIAHPKVKNATIQTNATGLIKGLYQVQVEIENHQTLGNLNDSIVQQTTLIVANGTSYIAEYAFPYWDEVEVLPWANPVIINSVTGVGSPIPTLIPFDEGELNDYFTTIQITYNTTQVITPMVIIRVSPRLKDTDKTIVESAILLEIQSISANSVVDIYRRKVEEASNVMKTTRTLLAGNRNLCEDFANFKSVRTQEIAVNATIELAAGVDTQQIAIAIFSALYSFIDPIAQFKTFQDLEKEAIAIEEIFDGPLLSNGFLSEIAQSSVILYASDLISTILQTSKTIENNSKFIAVENFSMNSFVRNRLKVANAPDCIKLLKTEQFEPRLSIAKSEITFFREGVELTYDLDIVIKQVELMRNETFQSLVNSLGILPKNEISPVAWTPKEISNYFSIQNDLPQIYGTQSGVADSASPLRKAQAKQLSGYLLFFEQILTNLLAQLANINQFFNINFSNNIEDARTYFFQSLTNSINLDELLISPTKYNEALKTLSESPVKMLQRKNQVLDHLLGRFGEELLELSQLQHTLDQRGATTIEEMQSRRLLTFQYLLKAKSNFLKNICQASANRAMGLRKSATELSGFEKRLYLKLGILQENRVKFTNQNPEVFYMIEHILLRTQDNIILSKLPLAFHLTLVFPSGFERDFMSMTKQQTEQVNSRFHKKDFRRFVEKTVFQECPAHIIPNIVWLDWDTNVGLPATSPTELTFNNFEKLYFQWLGHFVSGTLQRAGGVAARTALVNMMLKFS